MEFREPDGGGGRRRPTGQNISWVGTSDDDDDDDGNRLRKLSVQRCLCTLGGFRVGKPSNRELFWGLFLYSIMNQLDFNWSECFWVKMIMIYSRSVDVTVIYGKIN